MIQLFIYKNQSSHHNSNCGKKRYAFANDSRVQGHNRKHNCDAIEI